MAKVSFIERYIVFDLFECEGRVFMLNDFREREYYDTLEDARAAVERQIGHEHEEGKRYAEQHFYSGREAG